MLELTVRLVASLAVVVGLLLLLARVVGKRFEGRAGAAVQVLHRQSLTRGASVAVLTVGSRVLVVGATDSQVRLLTELDPEELEIELAEVSPLTLPASFDAVDDDHEALAAAAAYAEEPGGSPPALPVRPGGAHRATRPGATRRTPEQGALGGSVLSPDTWRQALAAATGRAS